ncbi:FMN-binding protein [Myxococcota bacterium]
MTTGSARDRSLQSPSRAPILVAAFAAGAQALLAQSLLLREELLLYGGNEIAVGAFLGLWLCGIVVGAIAITRWVHRADRLCVPLLLAQGALPLLAVLMARAARGLADIPAYEPFPLSMLLVWSIPVAVPVSLSTGALVPCLAARARQVHENVTGIYIAEALGSLGGGAGATALLLIGVDPATLVVGCAALGALGSITITTGASRIAVAAVAVVLLSSAPLAGPHLGHALRTQSLAHVLPHSTLIEHAETPVASLWLARLESQQVILVDGKIVAAFPDPPRVERAAGMLATLTGGPRRLLIIGTQAVDILPGLQTFDALETIVWVVPDPGLVTLAEKHVRWSTQTNLEIVIGDPIRTQDELARLGPFDAIWLLVDTPERHSDDLFLTQETLANLAGLLSPEGVMAIPVSSPESYVGPRLRLAIGVVIAGISRSLPAVRLIPGEQGLVLAARHPKQLDLDPDRLIGLYKAMRPHNSRITRDGLASLLDPVRLGRADEWVASLRADRTVQPSDFDRPLALFHNLLVRAEQEGSELPQVLEGLRRAGPIVWIPLLVIALFVLGGLASSRETKGAQKNTALVVLTLGGALSMGLNLLLLHLYQGRYGTVYLEAGWLFGLWMGGLALGGIVTRRICRSGSALLVGAVGLAAFVAAFALLGAVGPSALVTRLAGVTAFVLAGAVSGSLVPVAEAILARADIVGARAGVGIEAADHLGGALCALAVGIIAIPVLGLSHTAWLLCGVATMGLAAIGVLAARQRGLAAGAWHRWLLRAHAFESFPYRRVIVVLLALACAAWASRLAVERVLLGPRVHLDAAQLASTTLSPPYQKHDSPVVHYRADSGDERGVALASRAVSARVLGYGGPINLLIATTPEGQLRRVAFLQHHETPSYIEGAPDFMRTLEGKSILQPFDLAESTPSVEPPEEVGTDETHGAARAQPIDGITGATVTSRAILTAIEEAGRELAEPVFGHAYPQRTDSSASLTDPHYLYLLFSLALLFPVIFLASRSVRRLWLLLHVAVGGFWLGEQLSTVQPLAWMRLEPELSMLTATGLLVLVIVLGALFGPIYCGYLCPGGALQEVLGLVAGARRLSSKEDRRARFIKYVLLAMLVVFGLGGGCDQMERVDLLRELWTSNRSGPAFVALVAVGIGCLVIVRFGCRYLCPTGALLNLLNKAAPLARLLPAKKYGACDLGVRGKRDVDCLQCNRCVVGEEADEASGTRMHVFRLVLAGVFLLLVLGVIGRPDRGTRHAVDPTIREVNSTLIETKISADELSDKKAMYWHVVEP